MISRLFRRKKKVVKASRKPAKKIFVSTEQGYNPYDTLPGLPRERFGLTRQDNGEWRFTKQP